MLERLLLAAIATFSLYFFLQLDSGSTTPELMGENLLESPLTAITALTIKK